MNQHIRWKQRFSNMQKATQLMEDALVQMPTVYQRAATIQFFEMSYIDGGGVLIFERVN